MPAARDHSSGHVNQTKMKGAVSQSIPLMKKKANPA